MADVGNPTNQEVADILRGIDPSPITPLRNSDISFTGVRCIHCDIMFYVSEYWKTSRSGDRSRILLPERTPHGLP